MAFNFKIQGNFFVVTNTVGLEEVLRCPVVDATFYITAAGDVTFFENGESIGDNFSPFIFADIIDDTTGIPFVSVATLKTFLSDNLNPYSSGAGGEANTASNIGTSGVGVFKQKTGVDLEFKKINAGSSKITITDDVANNEVDVDIDEANLTDFSGAGSHGLVPDPTTATGKFLKDNGAWDVPAGSGASPSLRNVTSTDTFATASETINCTSGTFTVNLPTAVGIQGTTFTLVNSGTGTITLDPNGTETINGSLTIDIKRNQLSRTVQSDGSNWIVI